MNSIWYSAAAITIFSTLMVITRASAVHALLYLIVSLLSCSLLFFLLGAPFAAALEVIIYAGAIMVLFVFVIMMLNLGKRSTEQESEWLTPQAWRGPAMLCLALGGELVFTTSTMQTLETPFHLIGPKQIGIALFGRYILGVEIASFLLLAGLIGAYHLGRQDRD